MIEGERARFSSQLTLCRMLANLNSDTSRDKRGLAQTDSQGPFLQSFACVTCVMEPDTCKHGEGGLQGAGKSQMMTPDMRRT